MRASLQKQQTNAVVLDGCDAADVVVGNFKAGPEDGLRTMSVHPAGVSADFGKDLLSR